MLSSPSSSVLEEASGCLAAMCGGARVCRGKRVLVSVGAGRGAALRRWRRATRDAAEWRVHAWEADPAALPALRSLAHGSSLDLAVHDAAAWTDDTRVRFALTAQSRFGTMLSPAG